MFSIYNSSTFLFSNHWTQFFTVGIRRHYNIRKYRIIWRNYVQISIFTIKGLIFHFFYYKKNNFSDYWDIHGMWPIILGNSFPTITMQINTFHLEPTKLLLFWKLDHQIFITSSLICCVYKHWRSTRIDVRPTIYETYLR